MSVKISPSILASDFSSLGEEVVNITKAGADYIHVDVMDGHFVPNLTIGPDIVKSIRDKSSLPFDVHLMIDPVQPYIEKFVEAGADIVSVHPEADDDTQACIDKIKSLNVKAGLAINPDTEMGSGQTIYGSIGSDFGHECASRFWRTKIYSNCT